MQALLNYAVVAIVREYLRELVQELWHRAPRVTWLMAETVSCVSVVCLCFCYCGRGPVEASERQQVDGRGGVRRGQHRMSGLSSGSTT